MTFLAILISLFAERFLGSMEDLRRYEGFLAFVRWVRDRLPTGGPWDGALGVVLVLAPPVAAVALIDSLLAHLLVLLALAFGVVVLPYSLGPHDLEAEVEACADAMDRGDDESARWYAADITGQEPPSEPAAFTRAVVESTLVETNERLFGILFWFVLLGPTGAILYRLTLLLKAQAGTELTGFGEAVERLHHILAWPAARLCALGYALSGSFVGGI
ncbi:MAG TPA: cobalamin biosynthesis protein, partial [Gammaproteobacteria bacterium]|nr:cobalamin biosynthesis protein [Gammaproteobacteria bacterium]